jgi:sterol desaturase/sphingolipid hydroxylase (fatty acid hydroxylase superfamily)
MHKPEERVFKNWSAYKFLAEYHWLHHRYPNKNFNVVLPFADYVLGTCARPKQADLDCMREQLYGIGASKQPYWGSTNVAARKCHIDQ